MAGDIIFKTKAFGGFKKDEVMSYIDKIIADKAGLERQLVNLNSNNARLNGRIRELEADSAELSGLKEQLNGIKAENETYDEKLSAFESMKDELEQLKASLSAANAEIDSYKVKESSLEAALENAKSEPSAAADELNALKTENARLKAENDKMKAMEQQVGAAMLDARMHSDELVRVAKENANKVTREIYSGDTATKIDDLSTGISEIARNFTKAVEEVELRINVLTGNMSKTAQALISDNILNDYDSTDKYLAENSVKPDEGVSKSETAFSDDNKSVSDGISSSNNAGAVDEKDDIVFIDENAVPLNNTGDASEDLKTNAEKTTDSPTGMGDTMHYSEGEIEFI